MIILSNLRLATRLGIAFALMLLLTAGIGGLGLFQMGRIHDNAEEVASNWLPSIVTAESLRATVNRVRRLQADMLLDTDRRGAAAAELRDARGQLDERMRAYAALVSSPAEQAVFDSLSGNLRRFLESDTRFGGPGDGDTQRRLFSGELAESYAGVTKDVDALVEINRRGADAAHQRSVDTYETSRWLLTALMAAAIVAAALFAVVATRMITRPLARAVGVTRRVADGDLTGEIAVDGRDEVSELLRELQGMQQRLSAIVEGVRSNADSVATASTQIAQGNLDLSRRTESQASSLQQTSAAMEQLSTTVRNNADSASHAARIAADANSSAGQGQEVVHQLIERMGSIDRSSQRMVEIIGVIDGIAFQTNLLALNAAVEAARAGEQGRGFAVVASEVRTLAQRSANAAREVKTLIDDSAAQVREGVTLVDRSGKAITDIVVGVDRVRQLITAISTASTEQSSSVAMVAEAVSHMDQLTQQNAALVEQSAAAADSSREQARQLVDAVAVFRTRDARGTAG